MIIGIIVRCPEIFNIIKSNEGLCLADFGQADFIQLFQSFGMEDRPGHGQYSVSPYLDCFRLLSQLESQCHFTTQWMFYSTPPFNKFDYS